MPESIVIQPQPEGRELIILRFTGIIEQMCFEIGHRTIAVPTVTPQPGLPTPNQTHMVCNAETQEVERGEHATLVLKDAERSTTKLPRQFGKQTAGKAINPCTFCGKEKKITYNSANF